MTDKLESLSKLEEQLNELESVGNKFFDKVLCSLATPYQPEDAIREKEYIMHIMAELERNIQLSHIGNISGQQPDETLQSLKEETDKQGIDLFKSREKIVKNIDRVRSIIKVPPP